MFLLVRTITWATLFMGTVLIYVPARLLARSGIARPAEIGPQQVAGMVIGAIGAALALWCILCFFTLGKGTPFPFDPPRRLVIRGPYRFVRNPMYLGAAIAMAGAAVFYGSPALWIYIAAFLLTAHLFVVAYEEPTLGETFGEDYVTYRRHVRRWIPTVRSGMGVKA